MDNKIDVKEHQTLQFDTNIMNGDHQAVMINASIREGEQLSLFLQVLDKPFATANKEKVAEAVNAFIDRVTGIAAASNIPI